jgi:hypothetical protein
MRREVFEGLLRELARVSGKGEVVIVGSQSVHAATSAVPAEVLMSAEVDVLVDPADPGGDATRDALGKSSPYYDEHGVYVDSVLATFPFLPEGWEQRLRDLEVDGLRARCLEVHDLVLSKLAAGRLKDNELIASLIQHGLIEVETVRARIAAVADLHMRAVLLARLQIVLESGER